MKPNNQLPYFPHDANSRNKDKLIRLRMEHGPAGYGVYYMLLERLRNEESFESELDYNILSFDLDCDKDLIRSVINEFGLFEVTDEGRRFHSVELSEKMEIMLEAKRRKSEAAKNAAECRWGKKNSEAENTAENNVSCNETVNQSVSGIIEREDRKYITEAQCNRLATEIDEMKNDTEWKDAIKAEFNISDSEITTLFDTFALNCRGNGQKNGHKDIKDAFRHFRSYVRKIKEKAYDSPRRLTVKSAKNTGGKRSDNINNLDSQIQERKEASENMERNAQTYDNYFRNLGYEPSQCTFIEVGDPEWRKDNPPSHPEWIGLFPGREKLETVLSKLEMEAVVS